MDPSHHHHHYYRLHLHLDQRHHHHIHIRLCHHHHHHHHHHLAAAAPWQPAGPLHAEGPNDRPQVEATNELEQPAPHLERGEEIFVGEEEEEEEPVFVLTDEWAEFFAKSEAKRRLAKQQQKHKCRKK